MPTVIFPSASGAADVNLVLRANVNGGVYVPRGALERWKQKASPPATTLAAAVTTTGQITFTVSSVDGWPNERVDANFMALIGTEQVFVVATAGSTTWTCVRAQNGTTASTYAVGAKLVGDAATKILVVGDSTAQATTAGLGLTGTNGWDARLARLLAGSLGIPNLNPPLGTGYYPMLRSTDVNVGGAASNSDPHWTAAGGTWARTTEGSASDLYSYNWSVTASGATNILKFVPPPSAGDIKAIEIHYCDSPSAVPSYDINNSGVWTNIPGAGTVGLLGIKRALITSGSPITDFRIRAANAAGTSMQARIGGVRIYNNAPTFGTTAGLEIWNLAQDGGFLSGATSFNRTNASGDNFKQFYNSQGSIFPDLALIGPFTNDVAFGNWSDTAAKTYSASYQSVINALPPYCDKVLVTFAEQQPNSRSVRDQQHLRNVVHDLAVTNNCAHFDLYDAFAAEGLDGAFAVVDAGYMDSGDVHVNKAGHQFMADRLHRMLTSA